MLAYGSPRAQRGGPYPGLCEQWLRYEAAARTMELWELPGEWTRSGFTPDAVAPPVRRRFGELRSGAVVLARGYWEPARVAVASLWFAVPRELPPDWPVQLAALERALETFRALRLGAGRV